jgi:hypothetical protein
MIKKTLVPLLFILPLFAAEVPPLVADVSLVSEGAAVSGLGLDGLKGYWAARRGGRTAQSPTGSPDFVVSLLAKAQPDECFLGMGENNIYPFDFDTGECMGRPKANESYVFGLTRAGDTLWFGSAPNMGCLVYGTIAEQGIPGGLIELRTNFSVCEYAAGVYGEEHGLPDHLADWRPPSIYTYDLALGELTKIEIDEPRLFETLGLRSAGSGGNVVFLAGPNISGMGGPEAEGPVYIYAFRASTGEYLGSEEYGEYMNIRKWVAANGALYTGVMVDKDQYPNPDTAPGGAILRWTGDETNPFSFEVVGLVDGDPVELAVHEGRLFISTWPDFGKLFEEEYDYAGLWMSPEIPVGGLTPGDAEGWTKVWSARDYEQDEVSARMYNGGALASFSGYLYWGTTNAPMSAGFAHSQYYGYADPENPGDIDLEALMEAIVGAHRPISIFRGRELGLPSEEMEVLYGLETMPTFVENPLPEGPQGTWHLLPNGMGVPVYGDAGFGNPFNAYTWTMDVYDEKLFVGTMDWSHMLMGIMLPGILQDIISPLPELQLPGMDFGADLYVFHDSDLPAEKLTKNGIHNRFSYGVRTMVAADDGLYLGMANASNIATDLSDWNPEGGWELIRLTRAGCDLGGVAGDMDGSGTVNGDDLAAFARCYTGFCQPGSCVLPLYEDACCSAGDFNADGDVDFVDLCAFLRSWFGI